MNKSYNVGVGVGIVLCRDGKILFQQRSGAHGDGTWAPPGGKMGHGEDPVETGIREFKEETGVTIRNLQYLGFTNDVFEEGLHYITLWYVTADSEGEPAITEPHKCTAQGWYGLNELPAPLFLSTEHAFEDPEILVHIEKLVAESQK